MLRFAVVTYVRPVQCCYDGLIQLRGNNWYALYDWDKVGLPRKHEIRHIKVQAFRLAQIMILNEHDTEVITGIKPDKWGFDEKYVGDMSQSQLDKALMRYRTFRSLKQAIACAQEIG